MEQSSSETDYRFCHPTTVMGRYDILYSGFADDPIDT